MYNEETQLLLYFFVTNSTVKHKRVKKQFRLKMAMVRNDDLSDLHISSVPFKIF